MADSNVASGRSTPKPHWSKIHKPQTLEDHFIMLLGLATKKARKLVENVRGKKVLKNELVRELLNLPQIYVKSGKKVEFVARLGFTSTLFVDNGVGHEQIQTYIDVNSGDNLIINVVVLSQLK